MKFKRELTFKNDRGIRSDQHSTSSSTTGRPCRTFGVDSNVSGEDNGVSSVPASRLNPVDCVEDSGGGAIAGIFAIDTLDVEVTRLCEKLHEGRLDGLGLVNDSLSADFYTTNGRRIDVVLFEQGRDAYPGEGREMRSGGIYARR